MTCRYVPIALVILLVSACQILPSSDPWQRDETGLAGYALATAIAIGPEGTLYVATFREGAVYALQPDGTWLHDPALEQVSGYGVAAARQPGIALAATIDGVYRTDDNGQRWQRVTERAPFYAVAFDPAGNAWAGREGALLHSADGGVTWTAAAGFSPGVTVLGLAVGRAGLVLATGGGGILLYQNDELQTVLDTNQVVSSIAADSDGRLIARIEGKVWRSTTGQDWEPASAPSAKPVLAVGAAPDGLLAATEGAGVFLTRDLGETWEQVGIPSPLAIYAVAGGDRVYAATANGILEAAATGWQRTGQGYGRPLVRGLTLADSLYAATSDGVYRRTSTGWQPLGADLRDVLTLAVLPIGDSLFAGTWGRGVMRSDDNGRTWRTVTAGEYADAIIPALAAAGNTIVARVEYDRTIVSQDGGTAWTHVDAGLQDRTVFSLASDGRTLWAGTDRGVFRLNEDAWAPLPLLDQGITALQAGPGGLVAGTVDGLWALDGQTWRPAGLQQQHVVSIVLGDDGKPVLVGTSDGGVFRWNGDAWIALGLDSVRVNAVAIDDAGQVIVAAESGIFRLR